MIIALKIFLTIIILATLLANYAKIKGYINDEYSNLIDGLKITIIITFVILIITFFFIPNQKFENYYPLIYEEGYYPHFYEIKNEDTVNIWLNKNYILKDKEYTHVHFVKHESAIKIPYTYIKTISNVDTLYLDYASVSNLEDISIK